MNSALKSTQSARTPQWLRRAAMILMAATMPVFAEVTPPATTAAAASSTVVSTAAVARPQDAAKKVRIGVSIPAASHGWTAGIGWWAKRVMDMYPQIEWTLAAADKPEKQIADIEDMMVKGIDGLVILATESAPLTPTAKAAKQKGIFIVNVDRGFVEPNIADIFLEGDNKAFGRKSAEFMANKLGGKGNIVTLTGIPSTVDTDRVTAFKEVMKGFPDIKIVGEQPANWNREKGLEVMENFLTRFPKIDAVWAGDDDVAIGAIKAIKDAGREKELFVFPGAGMKEVVKMVMDKDPLVPANITYSPSMIAAGIHTAVSVLRDGKKDQVMEFMPRHLMIDVEVITPENAKQFYFPSSIY
jgi:ribose transport system substrate-binding protein